MNQQSLGNLSGESYVNFPHGQKSFMNVSDVAIPLPSRKNLQRPPAAGPAATLHASVPRDSCPSGRQAGHGRQLSRIAMQLRLHDSLKRHASIFWIGKHKKKKHCGHTSHT